MIVKSKAGRILLAFVVALNMLIPAGTAVSFAQDPPQAGDIIAHFNFEDGTQGWTGRGDAQLTVTEAVYQDGNQSMEVTGRTSGWHGPGVNVTEILEKSAVYEMTGYVMLKGTDPATLRLAVEEAGPTSTYPWVNHVDNVTPGEWVKLQGNYMCEKEVSGLTLYVESNSADAEFYVDNITIKLVSTASPQEPKPEMERFLCDFEDNTVQGFAGRAGTEVLTVTDADAHGGQYSLLTTGRTNNWHGPSINVFDKMQKGSRYNVSAWVRLAPGEENTTLSISLQRAYGGTNNYDNLVSITASSDSWVQLSGVYDLVNTVDALSIYVESNSETAAYYLDDFVLEYIPPTGIEQDIPSLAEVYADSFEIGAAVEPNMLAGDNKELLKKHYNSLVAENVMKPMYIQSTEGNFNWVEADKIVQYAKENQMSLRYHTLIWHSQVPNWFFLDEAGNEMVDEADPVKREANKVLLLSRLETHIRTIVNKYGKEIADWDVVNEVTDPGAYDPVHNPFALRNSKWYQIAGIDYIKQAFIVAKDELDKVGGTGKLYMNDFNTDDPVKRDFIYDLVTELLAEGVPIDGVGHQTHIYMQFPTVERIIQSIEKFGRLGLDNQITEMDVSIYPEYNTSRNPNRVHSNYADIPHETFVRQGYRFKELFEGLKSVEPYLSSVMLWGIADDHTWLNTTLSTSQGDVRKIDGPFPFDVAYQSKPAYWGMVDPSQLEPIQNTLDIPKGSAVVDGKTEFRWEILEPVRLTAEDFDVTFKTMWDENRLYLLADISDPTHSGSDRAEVFIDAGFDPSHGANFTKYILSRNRSATGGTVCRVNEYAGGYILEASIPLTGVLGDAIAFDIRFTNADTGSVICWNDMTGSLDGDNPAYGIATLVRALRSTDALYGKPVLDGAKDEIWNKANEIKTDTWVQGDSGSTAKIRTLWDEQNLYVFAEVTDVLLSDTSADVWAQDSIEIFIDQNYGRTSEYEADDAQYRVNFKNMQSFGAGASPERIQSVTKAVYSGDAITGYIVEAAVTLDQICPEAGKIIGFDFQVNNDENGDGSRDSVVTWNDPSGNAYQNTSQFGVLRFITKNPEPPPSGGSGKSSGGGTPRPSPTPSAPEVESGKITLKPVLDKQTGKAKTTVDMDAMNRAKEQASANEKGTLEILVEVAPVDGASSYGLNLPLQVLKSQKEELAIEIQTSLGKVTLPGNMLGNVEEQEGDHVEIVIGTADPSSLSEELRSQIGSRPVLELNLFAGDEAIAWDNPKAPVTVAVPYTPTGMELQNPEHIVVWYIDGQGNVTTVPNGRYNPETGEVLFRVTHFSKFAVAFVKKTFTDLEGFPWAKEQIEVLASKAIIKGTSEEKQTYTPSANITRADFLCLLIRTLELHAEFNTNFEDVKPGTYYYDAVGIAKKLGIAAGVGGNLFMPAEEISRQDMMTLAARALRIADRIGTGSKFGISSYDDVEEVADYAVDSVAALVEERIVFGNANRLNPRGNASRAEVAVVMYRIYNQ